MVIHLGQLLLCHSQEGYVIIHDMDPEKVKQTPGNDDERDEGENVDGDPVFHRAKC